MTTPTPALRLGTRRSALAMAQAEGVAEAFRQRGQGVELVGITTHGDRSQRSGAALTGAGQGGGQDGGLGAGQGVFVAELRAALLAGDVDVAVHSLKDLPTAPAVGLVVAAIPRREDPRDALVASSGYTLGSLPAGARVGTGSPRRAAQLRVVRPDLEIAPLRGNVDTRLRKVRDGELDAVVVAAAGLARLGRLDEASELLGPEVMLPAPGQGALAIECRSADAAAGGKLHRLITEVDDPPTRAAVVAERTVLAGLEAGCAAPVGALGEVRAGELALAAVVVSVDGATVLRRSTSGSVHEAELLGRQLVTELLAAGAAQLVGEIVGERA